MDVRSAGLALVILLIAGCRSNEPRPEQIDEAARFRNIAEGAEFVGDAACFDCHEDQWRGFQTHGMANSIYPIDADDLVETFPSEPIYHEGYDLYYRAYRDGDRFFQEEYRLDEDGRKIHSLVREMKLIMGSGTAARTYLTEENNHYYELPLTWYTQQKRWAFSPGYDVSNLRFDRSIPDRCMACHNNYPVATPFADGKYTEVPHGIGCERCHGPGSLHVDARLASPEPADSIDETIVNPAHLSLERRLDVCQQCHLSATVSVLREGRTAYDFRPAQPLDEYVAFFSRVGSDDQLEVISHADRMQQSPCFIETQGTDNPMSCTTCHDPHEGFREAGPEYFNTTCRTCHDVAGLQARMPSAEMQAAHEAGTNCFSCHMPKYEGTPHASFTDHMIRVVRDRPDAPSVEPAAGTPVRTTILALEPYFETDEDDEGEIYRGMAYVIYGRQQGDSTALRQGIRLLQEHVTEGYGEAYFLLGFAHLQLGEVTQAIPPLEQSVTVDPNIPERLNALAQAYEADGRSADSIRRLYERALSIQPALADVRVNYGRFLESLGEVEAAVEAYRRAIEEQPWLEEAHYNLGTVLLRQGEMEAAERALREAIHLNPDHVDALGNLGLLLASNGREEEAGRLFERAVTAAPDDPVALGNLGAWHLNSGSLSEAVDYLTRAVAIAPTYVDALANLALAHFRLEDYQQARTFAERTLRMQPDHALARQILGAL